MSLRTAIRYAVSIALVAAAASAGDLPQISRTQTAFGSEEALTRHYWNVPAFQTFLKVRATPADLRKRAGEHARAMSKADPALATFFKSWKPEPGAQIYVPVFADHAKLRGERVVVIVFNWEFPQAAFKDGRMGAGHVLIIAVRAADGKVLVNQRCG